MARTVRVYRSTDTSAPVLTGVAGALIALLDACLVTGYGSATAAGWTKPYTGTNIAVFRNSTVEGTGTYLRVQDDYASTNARGASLCGYEAMSAVSTGTGLFPEFNTYFGIWKSFTADAVARPWVVVADEACFYLFIQNGESGTEWVPVFFGDIFSYVAADPYRALIAAAYSSSGVSGQSRTTNNFAQHYGLGFGSDQSKRMPRSYNGVGSQIQVNLHTDGIKASSTPTNFYMGATGLLAYPNHVNNALFLAPVWVGQQTTSPYIVRGHMPGLWAPLHNRPLANNDTFSGTGSIAGKTFEAFNMYSGAQMLIETSNTWS